VESLENTELNEQDYTMVELRFRIPSFVAEWLDIKSKEAFKHRNNYVKDILISLYRRDNGR
jgi:hypothetical protein